MAPARTAIYKGQGLLKSVLSVAFCDRVRARSFASKLSVAKRREKFSLVQKISHLTQALVFALLF